MAWAPNYVTSAELAQFVRVGDATDTALGFAIAAASRSVDQHTGRQFGQVSAPEARYYTPRWDTAGRVWVVEVDDLMTSVGLVVSGDTADDGEYADHIDEVALRPVNAAAKGRPWTHLRVHPTSTAQPVGRDSSVEVVAQWGWTAVPDAVKEATLLQASRILSRRNSPHGIAGSPEAGSETRLLAKVDPDVAVALRPFCRVRWVA
jgi:hypothetical protein